MRFSPPPDAPEREKGTASVTSVSESCANASANLEAAPTSSGGVPGSLPDVERQLTLALSILDHGVATRHNVIDLDERAAFLRRVHREATAALAGASIEQLLEARGA
jgi:hypothetical protein